MDMKLETHILKLSCKDQVGIVAKISSILAESNCNIVESKQFTDQNNGNFFIRQSFLLLNDEMLPNLKNNLEMLAKKLNADFFLSEIESPMNTILLVSKFDHCLNDILFKVRNNSLNLKIKGTDHLNSFLLLSKEILNLRSFDDGYINMKARLNETNADIKYLISCGIGCTPVVDLSEILKESEDFIEFIILSNLSFLSGWPIPLSFFKQSL